MTNYTDELEQLRVQLEPLVGTNQDGTKIHPYLIDNRLDAATSLIEALIAKREQEAERRGRIDELSRVEVHVDSGVWTFGNDPEMAVLISERLAELNRTSKGGE